MQFHSAVLNFFSLNILNVVICQATGHMEILVPQPGIEPVPLAVEAWSPNLWITREFPINVFLIKQQINYQRKEVTLLLMKQDLALF